MAAVVFLRPRRCWPYLKVGRACLRRVVKLPIQEKWNPTDVIFIGFAVLPPFQILRDPLTESAPVTPVGPIKLANGEAPDTGSIFRARRWHSEGNPSFRR